MYFGLCNFEIKRCECYSVLTSLYVCMYLYMPYYTIQGKAAIVAYS